MNPSDLQPGDVVFFVTPWGYVDHVGIISGRDKHGLPLIIHAIDDKRYNCVLQTTLNPKTIVDDDGVTHDLKFIVARCKDSSIAALAAQQAMVWAQYAPPYSHNRLKKSLALEDEFDNDDKQICERSQQKYLEENRIFASIKYTARRDLPPVNAKKGIICNTFFTLCYQVPQLSPYTKTIDDIASCTWISDKHPAKVIINPAIAQEYEKYMDAKTKRRMAAGVAEAIITDVDQEVIALCQQDFQSSAAAWDYKDGVPLPSEIARQLVLPVDVKETPCGALKYYMDHSKDWTVFNDNPLELKAVVFETSEKSEYKEQITRTLEFSKALRTQHQDMLLSPRRCVSASTIEVPAGLIDSDMSGLKRQVVSAPASPSEYIRKFFRAIPSASPVAIAQFSTELDSEEQPAAAASAR
ncbi:MAG: hypothetical protein K0S08_1480 [Gammaproteobacteria bacterium]|jgi:hypothetical protein|nr:hypothetical protein [Gammaproteobacteria bacterium]